MPFSDTDFDFAIPTLRDPRFSQSLERGLAILGCFSPEHPLLGIADLAEELGMSRSITHRYAITLVALGYLEQDTRRKYRLGLRVTDLGMSAMNSTRLSEQAHPYIEDLQRRTGFAVSLAVLDGPDVVYVDHVRSSRRAQRATRPRFALGELQPAHCTALGKVLLAFLPEYQLRQTLADLHLQERTSATIIRKRALRDVLRHVHEDGLAVCDEELEPDLQSIAVPVRSSSDEIVAALSMDFQKSPTISLERYVEALSPHLIAGADQISARLGYRREDELIDSR